MLANWIYAPSPHMCSTSIIPSLFCCNSSALKSCSCNTMQLLQNLKTFQCSLSTWVPLSCLKMSSRHFFGMHRLHMFLFSKHHWNCKCFLQVRQRFKNCRADAKFTYSEYPSLDSYSCSAKLDEVSGMENCQVSINGYMHAMTSTATLFVDEASANGGAVGFRSGIDPLNNKPLSLGKTLVLVRHGLSSWNEDSCIQGSSDLSILSERGTIQAQKCRKSLANFNFDQCFSSPITRAKSSAELIWKGRKEPLIFLDTLRESNLYFLEGMKNVDAKKQFPEVFKAWREDPANFHINGVYPVVQLWNKAKEAWKEILSAQGELLLIVSHKSMLRALICTALGMGPDRFRSIEINNGGVSIFTINTSGEPMLQSLNMTAHLHMDGVQYSV